MNIPFLDTVVPYAMTPSHPEDEAYPWFAKMADLGTLIARQIALHYDATVIPFGLLQEPFYHITYPRYTLMAGIGNVIAHEISHHFDNAGIQYGPEGKGSELLSKDNDEMITYTLMEDCYSNLFTYSRNWTLPDERVVGLKLNPELSMNERIADQIALQLALEAYRDTNFGMTENVLPWLDMDKKQLYFLSLAQGLGRANIPTFMWRENVKQFREKNTLSTLDQDSNLELPFIVSLVYCDNSALDHMSTEVGNRHLQIEDVMVVNLSFLDRNHYFFIQVNPLIVLTWLSWLRSRPIASQNNLEAPDSEIRTSGPVRKCTHISVEGEWKIIPGETTLDAPDRDRTPIFPSSSTGCKRRWPAGRGLKTPALRRHLRVRLAH
uniref:Peptidase M13 C-terminal domain-containing protein n=1 Tax=Timema genevievae TaxID=629358 RepID=A0A7R9JR39_TIMGE|nr:unnamed protein product [Timema genevievae]